MRIFYSLIFIVHLYSVFAFKYPLSIQKLSEKEKLVLQMEKETIQLIEKKFNIYAVGTGGSLMQGIEHLRLCFQIEKPLTKEEARHIIVDCAQLYLKKINSNEKFIQLIRKQFSINEVTILLFILNSNGHDLYHPQICVAEVSQGKVIFQTNDERNEFAYKETTEETYEEALELLNK